jgi:hypothetical protein
LQTLVKNARQIALGAALAWRPCILVHNTFDLFDINLDSDISNVSSKFLTFCLRHAAQAFTLREIAGAAASRPASDNRWREAAGDNGGPLSVT